MKSLITLQIVGLACTNLFLFTIGDITLTAGLVFMFLFVPVCTLALLGRRVRFYGVPITAVYMALIVLLTWEASRFTSICYSMLFLACFVLLMNALRVWYDRQQFGALFKWILVAYFANIVLTQIVESIGLGNDITRLIFQINVDSRYDGLRYQGFASEPSYAAFICIVAYICWNRLCRESTFRHVLMTAMLIYIIIALQSVYGYLMVVPAVFVGHGSMFWSHRRLAAVLAVFMALGLGALSIAQEDSRLGRVLGGAVRGELLDPAQINVLDSSTFIRVGIFLEYILSAEATDLQFYFGHGAMAHSTDLAWDFRDHLQVNEQRGDYLLRPGFNIGFLYDYGLVGCMLVLIVLLKVSLRSLFSVELFIIIMMLFNANFNTLLFWYVITAFAACKMFASWDAKRAPTSTVRRVAVVGAGQCA